MRWKYIELKKALCYYEIVQILKLKFYRRQKCLTSREKFMLRSGIPSKKEGINRKNFCIFVSLG